MEEYAERLRALHRDLTLVLQAVERGLAAAARPQDTPPPVPAIEHEPPEPEHHAAPHHAAPIGTPIEIVPEPAEGSLPAVEAPSSPARMRMPRVEVMPPPSGEQGRDVVEDRRRPDPPAVEQTAEEPRWSKEPEDEEELRPEPAPVPRPAPRFPARPSAASEGGGGAVREPEWVDRGEDAFAAPTFPPPAPQRLTFSPWLVGGFVLAWLVVVALLIALLAS